MNIYNKMNNKMCNNLMNNKMNNKMNNLPIAGSGNNKEYWNKLNKSAREKYLIASKISRAKKIAIKHSYNYLMNVD